MARTGTFPLIDRVMKGGLVDTLERWVDEGLSNSQIARRLEREHDIVVSTETVRRWLRDNEIEREAS